MDSYVLKNREIELHLSEHEYTALLSLLNAAYLLYSQRDNFVDPVEEGLAESLFNLGSDLGLI